MKGGFFVWFLNSGLMKSGNPLDHEWNRVRALGSQTVSSLKVIHCFFKTLFVIVMNHHQGFSLFHLGTHLAKLSNASRWIEFSFVPMSKNLHTTGKLSCINGVNIAAFGSG